MGIFTWIAILTNFIHLFSCQFVKFFFFVVGLTKQNWFYFAFFFAFVYAIYFTDFPISLCEA